MFFFFLIITIKNVTGWLKRHNNIITNLFRIQEFEVKVRLEVVWRQLSLMPQERSSSGKGQAL